MKRVLLFVGAVALALIALPATADAGAPTGTGTVTIVHDATYDVNEPFPVTVCVNGQVPSESLADFQFKDIVGPLDLPADFYDIDIYTGAGNTACEGTPAISDTVLVDGGDNVTLAAIWTSDGPSLAVWPNDLTCTDDARVTVRHGADTGGSAVDVYAIVGGEPVPVVADLGEGEQKSAELPPGTADALIVTAAGGTTPLITIPGPLTVEAGVDYIAYAGGGADGDAGVWFAMNEVGTCTQPTTPTTPTTAPPTTPAPAAQAAAATPRFTG